MSQHLTVMPLTTDEDLVSWLRGTGVAIPAGTGSMPGIALLEEILRDADWPYRLQGGGTARWSAQFERRDGRWPPVQQLDVFDDSYSFRLGPLHGPWHVAREVSARCGPQVLVQPEAMTAVVVEPATSYEEVHLALYGVPAPADGSDRGWQ